jgi:outer membrane lipoprotein-sorting protein
MKPVRIALVASVAVVALALVTFVLITRGSGESEQARAPASYYFEARFDVSNRSPADPPLDVMRAWFKAPNKWRREISSSDPKQQDKGSIQVSDGETVSYYHG